VAVHERALRTAPLTSLDDAARPPGPLFLWVAECHAIQNKPERFTLLAGAGTYFTALFFRTIDNELCHYMTIGTHWIWHMLIALVTYLAMRSLILRLAPTVEADPLTE
jgi:hypothetical protein